MVGASGECELVERAALRLLAPAAAAGEEAAPAVVNSVRFHPRCLLSPSHRCSARVRRDPC